MRRALTTAKDRPSVAACGTQKGSLQDMIQVGGADLGQLIKIFVGACRGVEAFHRLPEPYAVRDIKVRRS